MVIKFYFNQPDSLNELQNRIRTETNDITNQTMSKVVCGFYNCLGLGQIAVEQQF